MRLFCRHDTPRFIAITKTLRRAAIAEAMTLIRHATADDTLDITPPPLPLFRIYLRHTLLRRAIHTLAILLLLITTMIVLRLRHSAACAARHADAPRPRAQPVSAR